MARDWPRASPDATLGEARLPDHHVVFNIWPESHSPAANRGERSDIVKEKSPGDSEQQREVPSWVGTIEASLGAVAMVVYFAIPDRRMPLSARMTIGIALLGVGILLSLWGIRFGRGIARLVAWVTIIVLAEQAFAVVLVSLNGGSF
jgi:hypothetical protein